MLYSGCCEQEHLSGIYQKNTRPIKPIIVVFNKSPSDETFEKVHRRYAVEMGRTYAEDWISQRIEHISQRTGNEWFPLVNARLAFTLNALTLDNEQNA